MVNVNELGQNINQTATGDTVLLIYWLVVLGLVLGAVMFLLLMIWKQFQYKDKVMIFELKSGKFAFKSNDSIKRKQHNGVTWATFRKNKGVEFSTVKYPPSSAMYQKTGLAAAFFGNTQLFGYLHDGQFHWANLEWLENKDLQLNPMPANQKLEYFQFVRDMHEKFGKKDGLAQWLPIIGLGAVLLANILFMFFIWQSNIATTDALKEAVGAMNSNMNTLIEISRNTVPSAPG